jgi:hypothetical protein
VSPLDAPLPGIDNLRRRDDRRMRRRVTDERPTVEPTIGTPPVAPLPLGLWAVAALLIAGGVAFLMGAIGAGPSFLSGGMIGLQTSSEGRVILAVLSVGMIVAAVGILLRIRLAWGLTMFIVLIGLAVNLLAYIGGDPNYLRLALFVVTAFYLNQRAVRDVFLGPVARRSAA